MPLQRAYSWIPDGTVGSRHWLGLVGEDNPCSVSFVQERLVHADVDREDEGTDILFHRAFRQLENMSHDGEEGGGEGG